MFQLQLNDRSISNQATNLCSLLEQNHAYSGPRDLNSLLPPRDLSGSLAPKMQIQVQPDLPRDQPAACTDCIKPTCFFWDRPIYTTECVVFLDLTGHTLVSAVVPLHPKWIPDVPVCSAPFKCPRIRARSINSYGTRNFPTEIPQ